MDSQSNISIKKVGDFYVYTSDEFILGSGSQATVYLAKRLSDGLSMAAKVFDITTLTENDKISIRRQLDILFNNKHPYILNCYDFIQTLRNIYLFSEYCEGGDLLQYIDRKSFISEAECLDIFKQIVSALQVLDKGDIAHRDLKTANILLKEGQVKIADFGFAKRIESNKKEQNTYVGSPIFMSPQALIGGNYDLKKSDVWSAGVCLYYMLFKMYPFHSQYDDLEELKMVVLNTPLIFPDNIKRSSQVKELLSKMLEKDEKKRYDLNQVANHECLTFSSKTSANPLIKSFELNQVTGLSSCNQQFKEQQLVQDKEAHQNMKSIDLNSKNNNKEQYFIDDPEKFISQNRELGKKLIDIHNLFMLFALFPQKYTDIWRSIKECSERKLFDSLGLNIEDAKKALILLMNTHYLSSRKQMKEIIQNGERKLTSDVNRLSRGLSSENVSSLMKVYFNQDNYKYFMINFKQLYADSQEAHKAQSQELFKNLEQVGFTFNLNEIESDLDDYQGIAFFNLNENLLEISKAAANKNNKVVLNLFIILLLLRFYEQKIAKEQYDFMTYYELIKKLESINFLTVQQSVEEINTLLEQIQEFENEEDK